MLFSWSNSHFVPEIFSNKNVENLSKMRKTTLFGGQTRDTFSNKNIY
jgi:hypothetical protein